MLFNILTSTDNNNIEKQLKYPQQVCVYFIIPTEMKCFEHFLKNFWVVKVFSVWAENIKVSIYNQ